MWRSMVSISYLNTLRPRLIAAISQTTFSNAFSWVKMYEFRLGFHWSVFLRLELTIFQHWFRQWLGADKATSHYLNLWWLVYWRIYASLGLNESKYFRKGNGIFRKDIRIEHLEYIASTKFFYNVIWRQYGVGNCGDMQIYGVVGDVSWISLRQCDDQIVGNVSMSFLPYHINLATYNSDQKKVPRMLITQ